MAPPPGGLRARLEAMAARHAPVEPPPATGPPPTDEEAEAALLEGLPGAVVHSVQQNT